MCTYIAIIQIIAKQYVPLMSVVSTIHTSNPQALAISQPSTDRGLTNIDTLQLFACIPIYGSCIHT